MPEPSGTLQKRDPPPRTSESGFSTGPLYAPTDIRHRTWRRSYKSGLIGTDKIMGEIGKTVKPEK